MFRTTYGWSSIARRHFHRVSKDARCRKNLGKPRQGAQNQGSATCRRSTIDTAWAANYIENSLKNRRQNRTEERSRNGTKTEARDPPKSTSRAPRGPSSDPKSSPVGPIKQTRYHHSTLTPPESAQERPKTAPRAPHSPQETQNPPHQPALKSVGGSTPLCTPPLYCP